MVLLFSEKYSAVTNNIIDWLISFKTPYMRLNRGDSIEQLNILISQDTTDIELKYCDIAFCLNKVSGYWLWRSYFIYSLRAINHSWDPLTSYLHQESEHLRQFLHYKFEKQCLNVVSNCKTIVANKLQILDIAASVGLTIPVTLVTNSRNEIVDFCKKHEKVIVKAVNEDFSITLDNVHYCHYTSILDSHDIESFEGYLFPCIIQPLIPKKYEIRSFYFDGKFYSMAIFSQNNIQTKIDFRKYDWIKPNRTTPYRLPSLIEKKLRLLLFELNLQTGSIDIIAGEDGKFYFLEINPAGQFGMTSIPCNYNLEKKIAEFLIKEKTDGGQID